MNDLISAQVMKELVSLDCRCGNPKREFQSFCRRCYYRLPRRLKAELYQRMGEGYEESFKESITYLFPDPPQEPSQPEKLDEPKKCPVYGVMDWDADGNCSLCGYISLDNEILDESEGMERYKGMLCWFSADGKKWIHNILDEIPTDHGVTYIDSDDDEWRFCKPHSISEEVVRLRKELSEIKEDCHAIRDLFEHVHYEGMNECPICDASLFELVEQLKQKIKELEDDARSV